MALDGGETVTEVDDGWRLGRRPGLDQVRGAAALMVVAAHAAGPFGVKVVGRVGVEVFFTLSGFLITRLLLEEKSRSGGIDLRAFYVRRLRRLMPVIPLTLVVAGYAAATVGDHWLAPTLTVLTYTSNYFMIDPEFGNGFGMFWSLAIEEHFYFVWPTVVLLVRRRWLLPLCGVVAAGSFLWRVETLGNGHENLAYFATHLRLDGLLIGAALALLIAKVERPARSTVAVAGVVIGASLVVPELVARGAGSVLVHLATAVLIVGVLDGVKRRRWLEHVGLISYGLYLLHGPILMLVDHHALGGRPGVAVGVVLAFGAAEFSYRVIESRFRSTHPVQHHVEQPVGGVVDAGGRTYSQA
jgi:peptidoglycan/LPS O-acetylase OafA/YrhL